MTPAEAVAVSMLERPSWIVAGAATSVAAALAGGLIGLLFFSLHAEIAGTGVLGPIDMGQLVRFVATGGVVGAIASLFHLRRHAPRPPALTAPDLEAGVVDVLHVTGASGARRVPELGGVEPCFVVDVGAGRLLFLRGLHLAAAVAAGAFPCTSFDVVRLRHADRSLGITCSGEPLPVPPEPPELDGVSHGVAALRDGDLFEGVLAAWRQGERSEPGDLPLPER
jgi:hypothetical protein